MNKKIFAVFLIGILLLIGLALFNRISNTSVTTRTQATYNADTCVYRRTNLTTTSTPYKYDPHSFCIKDADNKNIGEKCAQIEGRLLGHTLIDTIQCPVVRAGITPTPPPWGPIPCLSEYKGKIITIEYGSCVYDTNPTTLDQNSYFCEDCTIGHGNKAKYNCLIKNLPICMSPAHPFDLISTDLAKYQSSSQTSSFSSQSEIMTTPRPSRIPTEAQTTVIPSTAISPTPSQNLSAKQESYYSYLVEAVMKYKYSKIDIYVFGQTDFVSANAYVLGAIDYFQKHAVDTSALDIRIVVSCEKINHIFKNNRYVIRYAYYGGNCTNEGSVIQAYPQE